MTEPECRLSTRRSTRLSVAAAPKLSGNHTKPLSPPMTAANRTRFRNVKPANNILPSSGDDDSDPSSDDDNEMVLANADSCSSNLRRPVGRPAHFSTTSVPAATTTKPTAAATKRKPSKSNTAASRGAGANSDVKAATVSRYVAKDSKDDDDDDNGNGGGVPKPEATPPKQAKFCTAGSGEQKLVPVMLLDKLCLNSPSSKKAVRRRPAAVDAESNAANDEAIQMASASSLPAAVAERSKYQNARITLNSAETYKLPGRERELAELSEFLSDGLRHRQSASMYISGPPGTGKTASLSKLLNASEYSDRFQRVYVNCTSIASIGSIYKKICGELRLPVGTEKDCLSSIERYLDDERRQRTVLMVLDEVDQLVGKRQSVLYTIFEWPSRDASNLLLIGIANSLDLTDRCLSRLHAKCALKPRLMHFAPYTKEQIVGIFRARLDEAGVLDLFPPVTIQLLAAKVASISGDVRRALDIGRRVIELAEEQRQRSTVPLAAEQLLGIEELSAAGGNTRNSGSSPTVPPSSVEKVEMKQVMQVLNQVYGTVQSLGDDLDDDTFPLQQKILVCVLLLMLRCDKNKDITVGRLHGVYAKVCATRAIAAVGRSEFTGLCELVETRGIVRIIKNKEPRLAKVQMQWDEQEVANALQDKQLIASILADTAAVRVA